MKQALILSIIVHLILAGLVVFLVAPTKSKHEPKPIHITAIAIAPAKKQEIERQEQESRPTPKKITEPIPTPTPLQRPIEAVSTPVTTPLSKPIESMPTPVSQQKVVETPVSAPAPVSLPKKLPTASQYSAAETKEAKNEYLAYIRQVIDQRKIYPKNAKKLGQSGTAEVSFTVMSDGTIASVSLSSSSGFTLLDNAAVQILTQLAKVKPIPNELVKSSLEITIPIEYAIH